MYWQLQGSYQFPGDRAEAAGRFAKEREDLRRDGPVQLKLRQSSALGPAGFLRQLSEGQSRFDSYPWLGHAGCNAHGNWRNEWLS